MKALRFCLAAGLVACSSRALAQSVADPTLTVQTVVTGLDLPTTMAFIGNDDFLVLQKNDGRVRRVTGGVLQPGDVLDVPVDNQIDKGLLGIARDPDFVNNGRIVLYYTEAAADGDQGFANRVVRYTWNGSQLVDPHPVLDLPNEMPSLVGGIVAFGPDDKLYTVMGCLQRHGKLENNPLGAAPDDTGVILRTNDDGSAVPDNPFFGAVGSESPMRRYFAYGVRNSFGIAWDPVTGALWDAENGLGTYDEINRVASGFNSGWGRIQGFESRSVLKQDSLWTVPGSHYADPMFAWYLPVAPTAMAFVANPKLGCGRVHDLLATGTNCGTLYHFVPTATRDALVMTAPELQDKVADNTSEDLCGGEQSEFIFGEGFPVITDLKTGPDGNLYIVELATGTVYRIVPSLPAAADADGDGVDDTCDCNAADAGSWSPTLEVPRIRVARGAGTTLGWDSQRETAGPGTAYSVVTGSLASLHPGGATVGPCTLGSGLSAPKLTDPRANPAPGEGVFYLVRAGDGCGAGTFGDSTVVPDPRNALDAALPAVCPGL